MGSIKDVFLPLRARLTTHHPMADTGLTDQLNESIRAQEAAWIALSAKVHAAG